MHKDNTGAEALMTAIAIFRYSPTEKALHSGTSLKAILVNSLFYYTIQGIECFMLIYNTNPCLTSI